MRRTLMTLTAGLALSSALFAMPAMADMMKTTTMLDGKDEVPPNASAAKGSLETTYDSATKKLEWTVEYSGLTGPATAAHFHSPADPGADAPPSVPLSGDLASPIKGSATLTDAQAADMMAGKMYFNVHTAANKGGEIRGQLKPGAM